MAKVKSQLNMQAINNIVQQQLKQIQKQQISPKASQFFVLKSIEQVKKSEKLKSIRQQLKKTYNKIAKDPNQVRLQDIFEGYELILDIRHFFLGEKGEIQYSILWSYQDRNGSAKINEMIIDHKLFRELLFDKEKNTLQGITKDASGKLKFNTRIQASLIQILKKMKQQGIDFTVKNNFSNFCLKNQIMGKSNEFVNANLFKSEIERAERRKVGSRYTFDLNVKITTKKDIDKNGEQKEKEIFKYIISEVHGSPASSTVFSAIGKYAADEKIAKEQAVLSAYKKEITASINVGNLTEIYLLAKQKLNNGKNHFNKSRRVYGKTLYEIFQEVRANNDPFYQGGDILTSQIKSFLGSCPSLVELKTVQTTIQKLDQVINKYGIDVNSKNAKLLEKELKEIFIKKVQKQSLAPEKMLIKDLQNSLRQTISSLVD